jgi:hypothetical protein
MDTQEFFPANRQLPGDRDGGHDGGSRTPLAGTLFAAGPAVVVSQDYAPVVAVLVPAVKTRRRPRQGSHPCLTRASAHETDRAFMDQSERNHRRMTATAGAA